MIHLPHPSPPRPLAGVTKPLLRGVSHEVAAFTALGAWIGLALAAPSVRARMAARARLFWRRLDHAAIFLLIAGTYTPFCLLLGGRDGTILLSVVWGGAIAGVAQAVVWPTAPKPLAAAVYLLLGWVVVPVIPALRTRLGPASLALLAAGGLTYSLGAAVYALRRPDPFPRVFGYHEVFHALVIVAASLHFLVATRAVLAL
jgi:hemolysin III